MDLNMMQKTEILIMTLKGYNDKEVAMYLRIRGLTEGTLKYKRTKGLLPKRKQVLGFIASHFLSRVAAEALSNGLEVLSGDFLVHALNSKGVKTTTLRTWSSDSLKNFLQKQGVSSVSRNNFSSKEIQDLKLIELQEIAIYYKSYIQTEDYIPPISDLEVPKTPKLKLTPKKRRLLQAISQSLREGAETVGGVTDYLNSKGFTNNSGKPFGRWSVKLLLQEFDLNVHEKIDALEHLPLMEDWVRTFPKDKRIEKDEFLGKLNSYLKEGQLFKRVSSLYSSLRPVISQHNKNVREQNKYLKYKDQVEFAVYVKYKHKPITAEEMGAELGMCAMSGNRIMRNLLGIEPFDIWFKNLYTLVSSFVKSKPEFYIQDLQEYLQSSYIRTQRDTNWDYATTNLTYQRLQEKFTDLPNSLGRRT